MNHQYADAFEFVGTHLTQNNYKTFDKGCL